MNISLVGAIVFLDSYGKAMRLGVEARLNFIKPNDAKLPRIVMKGLSTQQALIETVKREDTQAPVADLVWRLAEQGQI